MYIQLPCGLSRHRAGVWGGYDDKWLTSSVGLRGSYMRGREGCGEWSQISPHCFLELAWVSGSFVRAFGSSKPS